MANKTQWTFKTWIANFKNVNLPIGTLAIDIHRSPDFPEEDNFMDIYDYLCSESRGCSIVLETFALAWAYYQASK